MLHPSYSDLMETANHGTDIGEEAIVKSRYSIVLAAAKRARQLIAGEKPLVDTKNKKALSIAVEELQESKVKILAKPTFNEETEEIYMETDTPLNIGEETGE